MTTDTESTSPHDARRAARRRDLVAWAERTADHRDRWIERNAYFHLEDRRYTRFLVPPGLRVLELGSGLGDLLASLEPSHGVGVDISERMVEHAQRRHPHLSFVVGDMERRSTLTALEGPFDVIVLSDAIGFLDDCQATFELINGLCHSRSRVIVAYYSQAWRPILAIGERVRLKMPQPEQNWLKTTDITNLLALADFEPVKWEWRLLLPRRLFGLGPLVNNTIGTLPGVRRLALRHYVVARPISRPSTTAAPSASVIIPCRNEAGNVAQAIARMPRLCDDQEIVFVEGHSTDGTVAAIRDVIERNPQWDIKLVHQEGRGKGDAVRKGFDVARGDILLILDADLTVAPEDLGKFYDVVATGRADYVQGTRLVYPLAPHAMRGLNYVANQGFAVAFSWLLNQRVTDTLCGTKVLSAADYAAIERGRAYFGDFDPFGDFDLIFGAAKLNLKMTEIPVRYAERAYGTPQISRFRDGLMLLRMVAFAFRKLKAPRGEATGP